MGSKGHLAINDHYRCHQIVLPWCQKGLSYECWTAISNHHHPCHHLFKYNSGSGPDNGGSAGDGCTEVRGRQNHYGGLYSLSLSSLDPDDRIHPWWNHHFRWGQWLYPQTTWSPLRTLPRGLQLTSQWVSYCYHHHTFIIISSCCQQDTVMNT